MFNHVLKSASVERLKSLLQDRYGRSLEISFLNDSTYVDMNAHAFHVENGILEIPIVSQGHFLAVAKIHDALTLAETSQEAISEIVRLVLEPAFERWFLNQVHQVQGPFRKLGLLEAVTEAMHADESSFATVVLITSKNPHRVARTALQVHEALQGWAFVRWSEIKTQTRSVQDLRELGSATLLVDDIFDLNPEEKDLFREWFLHSESGAGPSLVLGSTLSWDQIKDQNLLPFEILQEAGQRQIEADFLPNDRRFCADAIKLLLDKEAQLHHH